MISSMTGFGRGEVERDGFRAVFEVTSLNSRYLEISLRLPRWMVSLESALRSTISTRIGRGKVVAQLAWERTSFESPVQLNETLADWYIENIKKLAAKHQMTCSIGIADVMALPEVWIGGENAAESGTVEDVVREALEKALDAMTQMRRDEGLKLAKDFRERMDLIRQAGEKISGLASVQVDAYRAKLTQRIEEILGAGGYDAQRLAQEIAYMAERTDITEECVRLDIHCRHFLDAIEGNEPSGRRLNFLLQELNREVNTIGSKSASAEISALVVDLKEELEKTREQVQNIE
jgi:uncharacterized protein (TIGR00255 family)